jgi:hypothetical protein
VTVSITPFPKEIALDGVGAVVSVGGGDASNACVAVLSSAAAAEIVSVGAAGWVPAAVESTSRVALDVGATVSTAGAGSVGGCVAVAAACGVSVAAAVDVAGSGPATVSVAAGGLKREQEMIIHPKTAVIIVILRKFRFIFPPSKTMVPTGCAGFISFEYNDPRNKDCS